MASPEQLKQKELNEKRLTNRLRLATTRLQNAQQEQQFQIRNVYLAQTEV